MEAKERWREEEGDSPDRDLWSKRQSHEGKGSCLVPALPPRHQRVHSPGSQEQDTADSQVGKKHEEPHGRGEGVQEGEVARLAALWGVRLGAAPDLDRVFRPGPLPGTRSLVGPSVVQWESCFHLQLLSLSPRPGCSPKSPGGAYHVHSVEDADPQGHEGFGEVDDLLPFGSDGERSHSQVCLLLEGKQGRAEGEERKTEMGS